jgi:hypothetical protein
MEPNPDVILEERSAAGRKAEIPAASDPLLVPAHESVSYLNVGPVARTVDERRHKRIAVRHMKACIRQGETEEVVDVIDMSRSGLCFEAWKHYLPDSSVLVASPFTLGSNNIFQRARIIRAQRRAAGTIPGRYALMIEQ